MKREIVEKDLGKLYRVANKYYSGKKIEKYIDCLEVISRIHYTINDCYYDNFVDEGVDKIVSMFSLQEPKASKNSVLYYDGFGFDRRGLTTIYLRALVKKITELYMLSIKSENVKFPI